MAAPVLDCGMRNLVLQPRIKPGLSTLGAQSPSHQQRRTTRNVSSWALLRYLPGPPFSWRRTTLADALTPCLYIMTAYPEDDWPPKRWTAVPGDPVWFFLPRIWKWVSLGPNLPSELRWPTGGSGCLGLGEGGALSSSPLPGGVPTLSPHDPLQHTTYPVKSCRVPLQ